MALLVIAVAAVSIGAMLALQYRAAEAPPARQSDRQVTAVAVPHPAMPPPATPPVASPPVLAVPSVPRALPFEEAVEPGALAPLPPAQRIPALAPPAVERRPEAGEQPAWLRNAVASALAPDDPRPKIAIVIDDLGVDRERGARAIALPGPLTLAWLPYAHDLPMQTGAARRAGHELLVHMPMDPRNRAITDPGPNALLVDMPVDELQRRLDWNLSRFEGYVGINNHMGSRFTADPAALAPVMETLKQRGLLFLDSRTSANSAALTVARGEGVPAVARDVFLDHEKSADAVHEALAEVESLARRHGHAVAIGHPRDATLDTLAEWLPGLEQRGFLLVPLSALVRERHPSG